MKDKIRLYDENGLAVKFYESNISKIEVTRLRVNLYQIVDGKEILVRCDPVRKISGKYVIVG